MWKPIETAPRDATRVLLWVPDRATPPVVGYYAVPGWPGDFSGWVAVMEDCHVACGIYCEGGQPVSDILTPTHWMELPEPPEGEQNDKA